jgi:hypothetical protein
VIVVRTPVAVTEIPVVRVSEPYVDARHARRARPFAVTVKAGRTGSIVQTHRFDTPEGAWAFYREAIR